MKTKATHLGTILLVCFSLFLSDPGFTPIASAQTYYIQSQNSVPFPFDPYGGAEPITTLDAANGIYRVNDNTNDWELLMTAKELDAMSTPGTVMTANDVSIDPGGTNTGTGDGTYTNNFQPLVFGSNDLWIQLTNVDIVNQQASLILHGTIPDDQYQLLSTNILNSDSLAWTLGNPIITGAFGTNQTPVTADIGTNQQMFFRAHHANQVLAVSLDHNAIAPNPATGDPGQPGDFVLQTEFPTTNDLTVYYAMSGTASNGVDYDYLNGVFTIPATDQPTLTNIFVYPTANNRMQGDKTVTLTLSQTNDYLIDPGYSSASITILDSYTVVSVYQIQPVAYHPDGPPGIPAQPGIIQFSRTDHQNEYPPMTVYYSITGSASNGVDYAFLSGSIDFPDGEHNVYLDVNPLPESILRGLKTVTLTPIPTNGYFVDTDTNISSQTVQILDTSTTVSLVWKQDAIETNSTGVGLPGIFQLSRTDDRSDYPPMTVNYQISGTASNGVDYQTLSGTMTLPGSRDPTNILVNTIEQDLIESNETVTLTLVTNENAYYINTNNPSATLTIHTSVGFFSVAKNIRSPIGIDYYAPSNSLLVSDDYGGSTSGFSLISTNITVTNGVPVTNVVVTNWSNINSLPDEVYFTAPRMPLGALTNSAGFTNGDMFFGSGSGIGWLSAGATRSNLNWCILTNSVVTNGMTLRGGICSDQTGTFSNQIIAVTSSSSPGGGLKGVWRVDPNAHPTLIAQINTVHLEGVTTLTNDAQKWGPWAGKIITGDESHRDPITSNPDPVIYTIAPDGSVATNHTLLLISGGIYPEDFQVIPANQSLYLTAYAVGNIVELPSVYFTNYIGDLLIAGAGETAAPGLFIVHWDSQGSNFVTTSINLSPIIGQNIEHTTFAPIQLPAAR